MTAKRIQTQLPKIEIDFAEQVSNHERIRLKCEEVATECERMIAKAIEQRKKLEEIPSVFVA